MPRVRWMLRDSLGHDLILNEGPAAVVRNEVQRSAVSKGRWRGLRNRDPARHAGSRFAQVAAMYGLVQHVHLSPTKSTVHLNRDWASGGVQKLDVKHTADTLGATLSKRAQQILCELKELRLRRRSELGRSLTTHFQKKRSAVGRKVISDESVDDLSVLAHDVDVHFIPLQEFLHKELLFLRTNRPLVERGLPTKICNSSSVHRTKLLHILNLTNEVAASATARLEHAREGQLQRLQLLQRPQRPVPNMRKIVFLTERAEGELVARCRGNGTGDAWKV
mmetsp:Transcript_31222/g.71877  ORF Transcript_31222/g.71877 Transcript_31222/m.71877 type:complete len:278 (+) Transcript_31222:1308-2141(+)